MDHHLLGLPTRDTPAVTWVLRGVLFGALGLGIAAWMWPDENDSPAVAVFAMVGLLLVPIGIVLVVVGVVKAVREP